MYSTHSFEKVKAEVNQIMQQQPMLSVIEMAEALALSEAEVTLALPSEMVTKVNGEHAEWILQQLPEWGNVTTIVHSQGSIFEAKAPFAKGKSAHGYYNLMGGKEGQLHGHLKLSKVENIAFVSKPFKNMESHYIGFYSDLGDCVFKVYLGRDKKRQLIAEQVSRFAQMKKELV